MNQLKLNRRGKLALFVFVLTGIMSLTLLSSFSDWGTAYGQTAGPAGSTNPPAPPTGAPAGAPGLSLFADNTEVAEGGKVNFVILVNEPANAGTVEPGLSMNLASPLVKIFQTRVAVRNVSVASTFSENLNITQATSSKGTVAVSGNSVNTSIGDLAAGELITINVSAVAKAGGANSNQITAARAVLNGQILNRDTSQTVITEVATVNGTTFSVGATSGGAAPAAPAPAPAQVAPAPRTGTIPGMPNTGTNIAPDQNLFDHWQALALGLLAFLMLGSLVVVARNRQKSPR